MHPAMVSWWRARQVSCGDGERASCGPGGGARVARTRRRAGWGGGPPAGGGGDGDGFGGGSFGVRRPLRFLAYKLELDERQVAELARILDELKIERAQGEVDRRRTLTAFADAVGAETFDEARAKEAGALRVATAERLRDAVTKALGAHPRAARARSARAARVPDPDGRARNLDRWARERAREHGTLPAVFASAVRLAG